VRLTALLLFLTLAAPADTVHLKGGKKAVGLVVAEDPEVVVNAFHSAVKGMVLGVQTFPKEKVTRIVRDLPRPWHEYWRRMKGAGTAADCIEIARYCEEEKLKEERILALERALDLEPGNEEARKLLGPKAPRLELPVQRDLALRLLAAEDAAAREEVLALIRKEKEFPFPQDALLRALRSSRLPKGYQEDRPVAMRVDKLQPNARYTLFVPESYDPLVPTPLLVGLHGGGAGGADGKLVVGSGKEAMPFYKERCQARGWICVCPNALVAGWSNRANSDLIDAVLEELYALYNIDENRIYLTGHSMGGGGAWAQGARLMGTWAAVSPTASFGVQGLADYEKTRTGLYVYHSDDDPRTRIEGVRPHMLNLLGKDLDFVYTELPGRGHDLPQEVLDDLFAFFDLRRRPEGSGRGARPTVRPLASFLRKPGKDEKKYLPALQEEEGEEEPGLKALLDELKTGGGKAEQAVAKLAGHSDPKVNSRVGKIVAHQETPPDVRRYAAQVLGRRKAASELKALGQALAVENESNALLGILDAVGEIADAAAGDDLVRFLKRRLDYFKRRMIGASIHFSDWSTILPTIARACALVGSFKPAKGAAAVVECALDGILLAKVEVLYDRELMDPIHAARALAEGACGALGALGDAAAAVPLRRLLNEAPWGADPAIGGFATQALDSLAG